LCEIEERKYRAWECFHEEEQQEEEAAQRKAAQEA
jgi:hypothetical protein